MNKKLKGLFWILSVFILAFYFNGIFSFFVRQIPFILEEKLSAHFNIQKFFNECHSSKDLGTRSLKKLIKRIYPLKKMDLNSPFHYHIYIIKRSEVNAYTFLGGDIFVTSGLLSNVDSPEALAGILAHEMGHVTNRHVLEGIFFRLIFIGNDLSQLLFNLNFSKEKEIDADLNGLTRLNEARVSEAGIIKFFKQQKNDYLTFLSDHPSDENRIAMAQSFHIPQTESILTEVEWSALKHFCE